MGASNENFKATVEAPMSMNFNPAAWTLWGLDFAVWAAGAPGRMGRAGPTYLEMSQPVEGTTSTRRRTGFVDKLQDTPFEGLTTGYDLIKRSYGTYVHSRPRAALCETRHAALQCLRDFE